MIHRRYTEKGQMRKGEDKMVDFISASLVFWRELQAFGKQGPGTFTFLPVVPRKNPARVDSCAGVLTTVS